MHGANTAWQKIEESEWESLLHPPLDTHGSIRQPLASVDVTFLSGKKVQKRQRS